MLMVDSNIECATLITFYFVLKEYYFLSYFYAGAVQVERFPL